MMRLFKVSASCKTASTSSFIIFPTGIPVQSATTSATVRLSTKGITSGWMPCSFFSLLTNSFWRVCSCLVSFSAVPSSACMICSRTSNSSVTKSASDFHLSSNFFRRPSTSVNSLPILVIRVSESKLSFFSRSKFACSSFNASDFFRKNSILPGTACWLTATRAQAVSIKPTALSGSWRAGM